MHRHILLRSEWVKNVSAAEIMDEYNSKLYKKNNEVRLKNGPVVFNTVIKEVLPYGELITFDTMGEDLMGEVEFV